MPAVAYADKYVQPLPPGHRFPMMKYSLLYEQLMHRGIITHQDVFTPKVGADELALKVHTPEYLDALKGLRLSTREQRVSGFPHDEKLIRRELMIIQGTKDCAHMALERGAALNIAGGTHHAFTNRGEGFCLLNDQAVAAQYLLDNELAGKILIIDLDVHQGNGTAEIFRNNPAVYTFSMHGKNNYPLYKEISDKDVELIDGTGDSVYLDILNRSLDEVLNEFHPDFIFYQSGVDILETDKLGKLSVTMDGCRRRDEVVVGLAKQLNLPVVCTMGGGYSPDIKDIIDAHSNTFEVVAGFYD